MSETDAVLNDQTRRALRRRVRQAEMAIVGVLVAIVILSMAALTAILSVPWQLSAAVTVGAVVALPVAVPYAMLRVVGLSHQDVLYVWRQAYREAIAESIALSGTRQADVFAKSVAHDTDGAEEGDANTGTDPDTADPETDTAAEVEDEGEAQNAPTDPEEVGGEHEDETEDGDENVSESESEGGRRAVERNAESRSQDSTANEAAESATGTANSRAKAND